MGIFDIESACLCVSEHAFNPPPLAIDVYATPSIIEVGGDDEHLPALDALGATAKSVVG